MVRAGPAAAGALAELDVDVAVARQRGHRLRRRRRREFRLEVGGERHAVADDEARRAVDVARQHVGDPREQVGRAALVRDAAAAGLVVDDHVDAELGGRQVVRHDLGEVHLGLALEGAPVAHGEALHGQGRAAGPLRRAVLPLEAVAQLDVARAAPLRAVADVRAALDAAAAAFGDLVGAPVGHRAAEGAAVKTTSLLMLEIKTGR